MSDGDGGRQLHPAVWGLLGAAAVLLLASFTGSGNGMFGWGFMAGMMAFWMLVPVLLVVLVVLLVLRPPAASP